MLTVAGVRKLKGHSKRREVHDGRGLYLIIQPSGAKSWAFRYKDQSGRPRKMTLGTCDETGSELSGEPVIGGHLTLEAARKLASEARRQRALGRDPIAEMKAEKSRIALDALDAGERTFARGAAEYFREEVVGRKENRGWREAARVVGLAYEKNDETASSPSIIDGSLAWRWSAMPVADIRVPDIFKLIDECRSSGIPGRPKRKSGTVISRAREMAAVLTPLFAWLVTQRYWIEASPCAALGGRLQGPARKRVLTDDEVRALWNAASEIGGPFGAPVKLLLLTGARLSEVAKMRWSEIDGATWKLDGSRTKNKRQHDVFLTPAVLKIVSSIERIEGCDFVFTTNGRTPSSGYSKAKDRLDARMRKDLPKIEEWRFHDIRRTAATGMADIGVEPHIIEATINHVSGSKAGVAGIYNRSTYPEKRKAALERWAMRVEEIIAGRSADNVLPIAKGARK